jgi:hypothetical protein
MLTTTLTLAALLTAWQGPSLPRAQAPALTRAEVAAWREDLAALARDLVVEHKNLFLRMPRGAFEQATRDLHRQIPRLARHQVIVGLMRLIALANDAHTSLVLADSQVVFHALPIRFYYFEDGLFVRAASVEHRDLVGARVVRVGRVTPDAALDSVARVIPHENAFWVTAQAPRYLAIPEVLHALGLTPEPDAVDLVVEQQGEERAVHLTATAPLPNEHGRPFPVGWPDMADAAPTVPEWQRRPSDLYWLEFLPASRTLYVCYRAVANVPAESNEAFFHRAFAFADSAAAERVVLDVRENGGGNGGLNRNVLRAVLAHPRLDQPDRLFVVIGRATFSAAQQLVNDLSYYSNATLVGEPTGNAPNQFGDTRPFVLPRSHIVVRISSRWHQSEYTLDSARYVAPALYTPLTATAYRGGVDPALTAILQPGRALTLAAQLAPALENGDSVLLAQRFAEFRADPVRRYVDVQREANALGYRDLAAGRLAAAIAVFRLNTQAFPGSANVFDSYGEALLKAGRKADAIAAFRHALAIDSTFGSSRMWLGMLEGR